MLNFAGNRFVFRFAAGSGCHGGSIFNFLNTSINDEQHSFASAIQNPLYSSQLLFKSFALLGLQNFFMAQSFR